MHCCSVFLPELMDCMEEPHKVAEGFMKWVSDLPTSARTFYIMLSICIPSGSL